jgi:para-nitrobenzyl esterase
MRMGMKAACFMAMAALVMATAARADSLTVKTEQGKVHGKAINGGKVNAFLGLPYAAAPVGELRWKAPEPPARWKGERHQIWRPLRPGPRF